MDLKDRLEKIENLRKQVQKISHKNRYSKGPTEESFQYKATSIADVLEGQTVDTPYGPCFYAEKRFTRDQSFGEFSLAEVEHFYPEYLQRWIPGWHKDREDLTLEQTLFFDTETTGLAGGAGTYIFLLGLGFFAGDSFYIRQYFMSDYHQEEAVLWAVNQLFEQNYAVLVTYNGKCYDFPLMQTRFIMARLPLQLRDPYHLDLLFPTRRLWKRRLQDCSLSNIERNVLNIMRHGDTPGYLIPNMYFQYLQNKDARPLKSIFAHNLQDIISLVTLTTKIGQIMRNPLDVSKDGIDISSIGRIYDSQKDYTFSSQCYEKALECDLSDQESLEVLRLSSFAYKRQRKWEQAEQVWRDIITLSGSFLYYPYEELAKYYEHHLKDYKKAGQVVEEALSRLNQEGFYDSNRKKWQIALSHRLERIHRKAQHKKEA